MYDPLGQPNILQRRKQQLEAWDQSDTNKNTSKNRDPDRVKFPDCVQFWAACSNSDFDEADRLLSIGVDVNVAKSDGLTALHQACIDNAYEMVKFLIERKANVDLQDNEGWTPLHATAQCGYTEIAKILIDNGADLSIISYDTELAVDVAQGNQITNMIREAMKIQNVDEDEARHREENLLLQEAQRWLNEQISNGLKSSEPNSFVPYVDPKTGATPLHVAAAKEYEEVLKTLLKIPNINIDAQDHDGWSPLHAASHWGKGQSIRLLADANASIEIETLAVIFNKLTYFLKNQTVFDVADESVSMLLRQVREQRRQQRMALQDSTNKDVTIRQIEAAKRVTPTAEKTEDMDLENMPLQPTKSILKNQNSEIISQTTEDHEPAPVKATKDANVISPRVDSSSNNPNQKSIKDSDEEEQSPPPTTGAIAHAGVEKDRNTKSRALSDIDINTAKPIHFRTSSDNQIEIKAHVDSSNDSSSNGTLTNGVSTESLNRSAARRISAVMAPGKGEETETQRNLKARHLRSTRRSTQGVTTETLEEAKKRAQGESLSTIESKESNLEPEQATLASYTSSWRTRLKQLEQENSEADKPPKKLQGDDSSSSSVSDVSTTVAASSATGWRSRVKLDSDSNADSSSASSVSTSLTGVRTRRQTRDRVPTGKIELADVEKARQQLEQKEVTPSLEKPIDDPPTTTRTSRFLRPSVTPSGGPNNATAYSSSNKANSEEYSNRYGSAREQVRYTSRYTTGTNGLTHSAGATATSSSSNSISAITSNNGSSAASSNSRSSASPALTNNNVTNVALKNSPSWRDTQDYRRLYEEERSEKERLRRTLEGIERELRDAKSELQRLQDMGNGHGSYLDSRKINSHDDQAKELESLRSQNAKMKEENAALVRVISKLSKPS